MTQSGNDLDGRALALFEAALRQPKAERMAFAQRQAGKDAALIARVVSLIEMDAKSAEHIQTGHAVFGDDETDLTGMIIGDYRVTALIGKGGMGAVYHAERLHGDFTHNVAIKVIRRGAASDALIERFMRERQILADMSHPHIARLLGGGTLDDDTPYFIMELIDGAPITEWAEQHDLTLRERLALFLQACDAVLYAHQNMIIHRDITPNNVLVTQDGGVKFIDFGIAKPLQISSAINDPAQDTGPVSALDSLGVNSLEGLTLTPGFAAPERSKGASPNTLSDIYSLGMLLAALTSSPSPNFEIHAIAAKATQANPQDRYPAVDALMRDIIAFQKGHPVAAHKGGRLYNFGKLIKRQKLASSLVALAAIAGTAAYAGVQHANTAQIFADARLSETRQMTTFLLEDLPASLHAIPGTLPVQKRVTEVSAEYLDILSKAAKNDPAVLFDYAMGHAQLGEILTVAGGANIGDPVAGLGHYDESLKTLYRLESTNPNNDDLQLALAQTEHGSAYAMMYHQGEVKQGGVRLGQALRRYEALRQNSDDPELKLNHALARLLDLFYSDTDGFFQNKSAADAIRADYEALIKDHPDVKGTIPQYASFLRNMAHGPYKNFSGGPGGLIPTEQRGVFEQGLADINLSLSLLSDLLAQEPTNSSHIYQYVWSAEILVLMNLVDKGWEPRFLELIDELAADGAPYTPQTLKQRIGSFEPIAKDTEKANGLLLYLERGDALLSQIAPYDADTFTHIEASYYNLKLHSYIHGRFRLDFDQAHAYNDQAKAMIDAFQVADPDFRNAYLEDAITHTEKAYIYTLEQSLMGSNNDVKICEHLTQAEALWVYAEDRWGEIIDYKDDVDFTTFMMKQSACE